MNWTLGLRIAFCSLLALPLGAHADADQLSFGVIGHTVGASGGTAALQAAITASDADNLGFVVAAGIKSSVEPCSDTLYRQRKDLLASAQNGLVVSLAASDWADCSDEHGKSNARERLAYLRDTFFNDDFSLGASRIPLTRQSSTPKYRDYPENARWEMADILFATVNLPADNNHYLNAAGRNSEFEDRQIATRHWLQRLFLYAKYKKMRGIVLFCDGNPLRAANGSHDGFADTRRQLETLGKSFAGRVLIVHGQQRRAENAGNQIEWHGRQGVIGAHPGWLKISARGTDRQLFSVRP